MTHFHIERSVDISGVDPSFNIAFNLENDFDFEVQRWSLDGNAQQSMLVEKNI